jgi:hypothetical protein
MFMPKAPVSVTLDRENLLWLRGRVASRKRRSLSDAIDEIVTAARLGGSRAEPARSVAGTIAIAEHDAGLENADTYIRALFDASLARGLVIREDKAGHKVSAPRARKGTNKGRRARG